MTTRSLVAQLTDRLVQHPITGTRPAAPSDGVDLASWKLGGYGPVSAVVYLDGTTAATITAPSGGAGAEVWGGKLQQWWLIGVLNVGAAIPIAGDGLGAAFPVEGVGGFDRLFVAGSLSEGSGTARFVPLEVLR